VVGVEEFDLEGADAGWGEGKCAHHWQFVDYMSVAKTFQASGLTQRTDRMQTVYYHNMICYRCKPIAWGIIVQCMHAWGRRKAVLVWREA